VCRCVCSCAAVCAGVCRCVLVCRCMCRCVCSCVCRCVLVLLCRHWSGACFGSIYSHRRVCVCAVCLYRACARVQSYHGAKRTTTRRLTIHAHCSHPSIHSVHARRRPREILAPMSAGVPGEGNPPHPRMSRALFLTHHSLVTQALSVASNSHTRHRSECAHLLHARVSSIFSRPGLRHCAVCDAAMICSFITLVPATSCSTRRPQPKVSRVGLTALH